MMRIILGSQSPRRKEILELFKLPFTVVSSNFDESSITFDSSPQEFVETQAKEKALALQRIHQEDLIITADTTVYFNHRLFQKPSNEEEAFVFLKELSGNTHEVFTGIAILYKNQLLTDVAVTLVTFYPLTDRQIRQYILSTNPLDKAGAYGIQELGCLIVSKIEGCYYNVMGLPVHTLCKLLKNFGIDLWDYATH